MKIICSQKELTKSIAISMRAVSSKSSDHFLESIVIDTREGKIKLVSNNMELGIETYVNGQVIDDASFSNLVAINANLFYNIIKSLPDTDITIEYSNGSTAIISYGNNLKFEVLAVSAEEYPFFDKINNSASIKVSQLAFKNSIIKTSFAALKTANGDMMTGVSVKVNGNLLRMAALNGHRIAIRNMQLNENSNNMSMIIPSKSLDELSVILSNETDKWLNISMNDKNVMFEMDDTVVLSRLIDGEYFKVEQMLSNDYETKMIIDRSSFISCIQRAKLVITESEKKPVVLNIKDSVIEIKMRGGKGNFDENVDIEKTGRDIMIGFNPDYMLSACNAIDDEKITAYFINSKAPCFIKDADEKYIYLILPINITAE
jgi:DNA polymerase III subunit beta